jgi:hypothetical protein
MRTLLRRLPETARVDRAGLVAGLPDDVRLWLAKVSPREIGDLVEATRDRSEGRQIRAVLDDVSPSVDEIGARLDVGEGAGGTIGLICAVDPAGSPPQVAARWRPLLDGLVATGLCTPDTRAALLTCYGLLRESQAERWPEHLTKLSALLGDGSESILQWRLAHIEIVCDRGEPISATARIVAAYGWSRR